MLALPLAAMPPMMSILIAAALLDTSLSETPSSSCDLRQDETSLLQMKQDVTTGTKRSEKEPEKRKEAAPQQKKAPVRELPPQVVLQETAPAQGQLQALPDMPGMFPAAQLAAAQATLPAQAQLQSFVDPRAAPASTAALSQSAQGNVATESQPIMYSPGTGGYYDPTLGLGVPGTAIDGSVYGYGPTIVGGAGGMPMVGAGAYATPMVAPSVAVPMAGAYPGYPLGSLPMSVTTDTSYTASRQAAHAGADKIVSKAQARVAQNVADNAAEIHSVARSAAVAAEAQRHQFFGSDGYPAYGGGYGPYGYGPYGGLIRGGGYYGGYYPGSGYYHYGGGCYYPCHSGYMSDSAMVGPPLLAPSVPYYSAA